MWTQEPTEMLVEAVESVSPVQSPAARTCRIHLPAAEEEVAVVEEVAAVEELADMEELAAVEELTAVEELAAVGGQQQAPPHPISHLKVGPGNVGPQSAAGPVEIQ